MKRESFIVYKSFYSLIKMLKPKSRLKVFEAIFEYGFNNTIPDFGEDESAIAIWEGIFPQLRANQKRYENGLKGGAPQNNQNAKKIQPKNNQSHIEENNQKTTKKQPNENDKCKMINVKCYLKEEENKEEEKSSSSFDNVGPSLNAFLEEFNIGLDSYDSTIYTMDFEQLTLRYRESEWLKQNITSFKKICECYPKIISGYYKSYDKNPKEDKSWDALKQMFEQAKEQEEREKKEESEQ